MVKPFVAFISAFLLTCYAYDSSESSDVNLLSWHHSDDCPQLKASKPSTYWYEEILHNGQSSFLAPDLKANYTVFRNVVDFGADPTGRKDSTSAIQNAINAGALGIARGNLTFGTTGQPAIVYIPKGSYLISRPLRLYIGTVLTGNPIDRPILKGATNFNGTTLLFGQDPISFSLVNFYIAARNLVIDSTLIPSFKNITLVDWTVSQATQFTNVFLKMPKGAIGHTGLITSNSYTSNLVINDFEVYGGNIGISLTAILQMLVKNVKVSGSRTCVKVAGEHFTMLGAELTDCTTGIDTSGVRGTVTLVDSVGKNLRTFLSTQDSIDANFAIALENIKNDGITVALGNKTALTGSLKSVWLHGIVYSAKSKTLTLATSQSYANRRPEGLLVDGKYFTKKPPTYKEFHISSFLNIKAVTSYPVRGDGSTDDARNINAILSKYTGCKIIYFPAGTYIARKTIKIPPGTRIIGDPYGSMISAKGSFFDDPDDPKPLLKIGEPGDVGVAEVSDIIVTGADVLPGLVAIEVNMAGSRPGDVGFWNTHHRIGGAFGSRTQTECAQACLAAWALVHLRKTASVYIENMWAWSADHDLDGQNLQTIATGRGFLIESTKPTWMIGTGSEHNVLYQYNYNGARNVFSILQQAETPDWHGTNSSLAPFPWAQHLITSDPSFQNCPANDRRCREAWYQIFLNSKDVFQYGVSGLSATSADSNCNGDCQLNAIDLRNSEIYFFGLDLHLFVNLITNNGTPIITEAQAAGGMGGAIAGYLGS